MSSASLRIIMFLNLLVLLAVPIQAQNFQSISARSAIDSINARFGPEASKWIAEMRGQSGQPQPQKWQVLTYNPRSTGLLQKYTVQPGAAMDAGPENQRYPDDSPNGFFSSSNLGVDSVAAFTIAEAEARKAQIGFDSCDYFLKVREYSREPVWKLSLIDSNRRVAGSVFISGNNGEVLRTIWIQRNTISGYPTVVDSLTPKAMAYTGITDGNLRYRTQMPTTGNTGLTAPPTIPNQPNISQSNIPPYIPPTEQIPPAIQTIPPPPTNVPVTPQPSVTSRSIFKNGTAPARPVQTPSATSTPRPSGNVTAPPLPIPKSKTTTKRITAPGVPGQ